AWNIAMRRRYGIGSPFSLRVVLMFATLPAIVSIRVRWASSALAPMSSVSNMVQFLSHAFLQRHFHRPILLAKDFHDHIVKEGVLRMVGHQLFHRAVVSIMEHQRAVRVLNVGADVGKLDAPWRRVVSLFNPIGE